MRLIPLSALWVLGFALLLPMFPAEAADYFNWGAEGSKVDYGVNGPGIYDVEYKSGTIRDCAVSHGGACSLRLDVIGNDSGNQSMGVDVMQWNPDYPWNFVGSPALYYRFWMRIEPGFSWGSGTAKTKSSRVISGTQGYTGYLMDYGFLIGECASFSPPECLLADGSSNGSDSSLYIPYDFTTKDDGLWHEYIVKIRSNTIAGCTAPGNCDALFQVWVDGASIGEYNDYRLHYVGSDSFTDAWGGWMVAPYFQLNGTVSDGGRMYLDDFSTDDTYNSLPGSPDTTPPGGPVNLAVQ